MKSSFRTLPSNSIFQPSLPRLMGKATFETFDLPNHFVSSQNIQSSHTAVQISVTDASLCPQTCVGGLGGRKTGQHYINIPRFYLNSCIISRFRPKHGNATFYLCHSAILKVIKTKSRSLRAINISRK